MERIVSLKDFEDVYELFIEAFPPAELRLYELTKQFYEQDIMKIYVIKQDEDIVGAISVWEFDDFVYVENFAVSSKLRGQGLGGVFLKEMKVLYPHHQLVLEVEEPVNEMAKRRIEFYQRNGFVLSEFDYIQPPFRENEEDVTLVLMTYPQAINHNEFLKIKNHLFKDVYLVKD